MGHARAQFWHCWLQLCPTRTLRKPAGKGGFFGATHADSVPIGQNEHHVRGAKASANPMPTTVVAKMIFQNTIPIAPQSPQAKRIWTPNMAKMNPTIAARNPTDRRNPGIGRWGDTQAKTPSKKLPRGQTRPHHHRPRQTENSTGPIMHKTAAQPKTGKHHAKTR